MIQTERSNHHSAETCLPLTAGYGRGQEFVLAGMRGKQNVLSEANEEKDCEELR